MNSSAQPARAGRKVSLSVELLTLSTPFRITGHVFSEFGALLVQLEQDGVRGRGEASGVYYLDETGESMLAQAQSVVAALEQGATRRDLLQLLPAGGARNAIDCALWDLEAKLSGKRIWALTDIYPGQTITFLTVGIDQPGAMAAKARSLASPNIKVKVDGERPLEQITAVREARPDALIIVDVNQGWSFAQLRDLAPRFRDLNVSMIEQPLPRGGDAELEGFKSPVMLCADESCLDTSEFEQAARRYQMINIKLDKTGGLTEALDLAARAEERGIELMVGNMVGTSLAMAPGYVLGQLCRFVDLDGALYLTSDRQHPMTCSGGVISAPEAALWG